MVNKAASSKSAAKSLFTQEEELLLKDFSRSVSKKSSLIFYFYALIVSAIPIWLYWRIYMMDLLTSSVAFIIVTAISTYLVTMAYKSTKFLMKHKMAQKLDESVAREVLKNIDEKKVGKKERDERILWKKNEVADNEATAFSLFYINALYLFVVIIGSFLLFRSMSPMYNYITSTLGAAGLCALLSSGTKH